MTFFYSDEGEFHSALVTKAAKETGLVLYNFCINAVIVPCDRHGDADTLMDLLPYTRETTNKLRRICRGLTLMLVIRALTQQKKS